MDRDNSSRDFGVSLARPFVLAKNWTKLPEVTRSREQTLELVNDLQRPRKLHSKGLDGIARTEKPYQLLSNLQRDHVAIRDLHHSVDRLEHAGDAFLERLPAFVVESESRVRS